MSDSVSINVVVDQNVNVSVDQSENNAFILNQETTNNFVNISVEENDNNFLLAPTDLNQGQFYPLSNPSGFLMASDLSEYVTSDELTDALSEYTQSNTTSDLLSDVSALNAQTGQYALKSQTGDFITRYQTGQFAPAGGSSIPIPSDQFYLASNPSGFITTGYLSNYVTGEVIRPNQTGLFYAANNPSGFIRENQTGAFYPASNPSGFLTGISNIVYTTGDQSIAGNKTFQNDIQIVGNISAPNQNILAGSLLNSNSLISLLENTAFGQYISNSVTAGGNNQFAGVGSIGFGGTPTTGSAAGQINYAFTKNTLLNDTSLQGATAGGGYYINYSRPFIVSFGFTTTISSAQTAYDIEIRYVYGKGIGTTGKIISLGGRFGGFGLKLTKHPTNNTYVLRMFTRSYDNASDVNITGCTNASPIVVTTPAAHNLTTGERVEITRVTGNTAANGEWIVTVLSPTTFSLNGSTGNGTYTSSGTVVRITDSFLELPPNRFYKGYFNWNPTTNTVSFSLGAHTNSPSLTLFLFNGAAGMPSTPYQTGNGFGASIASITQAPTYLGIQISSPTIYQY